MPLGSVLLIGLLPQYLVHVRTGRQAHRVAGDETACQLIVPPGVHIIKARGLVKLLASKQDRIAAGVRVRALQSAA